MLSSFLRGILRFADACLGPELLIAVGHLAAVLNPPASHQTLIPTYGLAAVLVAVEKLKAAARR